MRRVLVTAAVGLSLVAIALAGAFVFDTDDAADVVAPTSTAGPPETSPDGSPATVATTTTALRAPVESSGAAPVEGAILSRTEELAEETFDVTEETDCSVLDDEVTVLSCTRLRGWGGSFLVFLGERGDGALQARLYAAVEPAGTEFAEVSRSKWFEPGGDVAGMSLFEAEVGGEPVVVVDYDFGGSGSVHSFDVVAWDEADDEPRVVAYIGGTGSDRFSIEGDALQFVSANYEDGAPTCCPNFADVRTLEHPAPGAWELTEETVPFSAAP